MVDNPQPDNECENIKENLKQMSTNVMDNSASFTSSRTKDFCQKWKVKLIYRGT